MNSLKQVRTCDWIGFKDAVSAFMSWYMRECETITGISEEWREPEEDTLVSIFSAGLKELRIRTDMMKEADRVKE